MATAGVALARAAGLLAQLVGLAVLAGALAAVAGAVYRWYVDESVPRGLALLVGLSGVALYLNTTTALGQVIGGSSAPTGTEVALFNIVAFAAGVGGAALGRRVGDRFGETVLLGSGDRVESDVGRLVKTVGRVISVELPEEIDDAVGYDPVPAATKEALAGKTFLFPRGLTVGELRERLTERLETDYRVGHVDVELAADGSVGYLALGSRAAGIGPTLPPATNAVAVRADPAFAASAGDLVQVWRTDPLKRVLTAELRGVTDETVTLAIGAGDTPKLDPTEQYRLVTLPVEDRPEREFASLLRGAEETFSAVTVQAGSALSGLPVGALAVTVVAIEHEGGESTVLPGPRDVLAAGDRLLAVARPAAFRRLEAAAETLPQAADAPAESSPDPDRTGTELETGAGAGADVLDSETGTGERGAVDTDSAAPSDEDDTDGRSDTDSDDDDGRTDEGTDGSGWTMGSDWETSGGGNEAGGGQDGEADSGDEGGDTNGQRDERHGNTAGGPEEEDDELATDSEKDEPADGDRVDGSGRTFRELKAEFESGDADWTEDDGGEGAGDGTDRDDADRERRGGE